MTSFFNDIRAHLRSAAEFQQCSDLLETDSITLSGVSGSLGSLLASEFYFTTSRNLLVVAPDQPQAEFLRDDLSVAQQSSLPPAGMMTFLMLEKPRLS